MPELQRQLDALLLRLDQMGLRVERAVREALDALVRGDVEAGRRIDEDDAAIDREEVQIEQDAIRLLALYQPAAVDLRSLCAVIKINNDLERVADIAARIGRRVPRVVEERLDLRGYPGFRELVQAVADILARTVNMLSRTEVDTALSVIERDRELDRRYAEFLRAAVQMQRHRPNGLDAGMTLLILARSLERIGDHCTNIAEDVVYLRTGDIIRHTGAFQRPGPDGPSPV